MIDFSREGTGVDPRQLYILENGEPTPCPDRDLWAKWMSDHNPVTCFSRAGAFTIKTYFTGILEGGKLFSTEVTPRFNESLPDSYESVGAREAIVRHVDLIQVAISQMKIRERSPTVTGEEEGKEGAEGK